MRLAMGAVAVTCGLWLSGGTFRAAQADTDLTCRIPNPRPPAFFSPAPRTPGAVRTYSGTIGRRMVTMTLKITAGEASGSYVYNQIGQPIQLRGRLSGARLMLREFGDLREPSESTGSFDLSAPAPSDALRGSWHAPDGSRSTPVRLNRIAEDVEEPRVLLAWERRAPADADWSWLADVDYSPVRGELVYLEQPNVIAALDLASMRRRTVLALGSDIRRVPDRQGGTMPLEPGKIHHLVVSHNGDRLAFSAGPDTFLDVYVMGIAGTTPTRMTDSLGDFDTGGRTYYYNYMLPKFSPDDRTLLFQILHGPDPNNRIALVSSSGGPMRTLGEGYTEAAYWSADGTRICTNSDARTGKKIVYDLASGKSTVGAVGSMDRDRERACRVVGDAVSIETCDVPRRLSAFESFAQRWLRPDVVVHFSELTGQERPGYRIEVVQLW